MQTDTMGFLPEKFDVIFFDSVGTPYIGSSPRMAGLGGSEFQTILVAEGLAKEKLHVACFNNTPFAAYENGVWYFPKDALRYKKYKTKALVNLRNSQLPTEYIDFERLFVWVTDLPGPHYDIINQIAVKHPDTTLIAVSKWHHDIFSTTLNKTFIYNSLPDSVYDYSVRTRSRDVTKFLYASAAMKGLNETVSFFKTMKKDYFFKKAELVILSPGYDSPDKSILDDKKLIFKGALPFQDVVKEMAASNALLYVNKIPETFGISVALAEVLGCTPFILYTNHAGALPEISNGRNIMSNPEMFYSELVEFVKDPSKYRVEAKDFRLSKMLPIWRTVLGV